MNDEQEHARVAGFGIASGLIIMVLGAWLGSGGVSLPWSLAIVLTGVVLMAAGFAFFVIRAAMAPNAKKPPPWPEPGRGRVRF